MIDVLFGFRGRLGRLAFLGWNVAAFALVAIISIAYLLLGAGLSFFLSRASGGPEVLGLLMAVTAGGAGIWIGLALTAKRIRDTGWAPLPMMVATVALLAFDQYILTRFTGVRFFSPFANQTPLGGLLTVACTIYLICWPSASRPAFDAQHQRK